MWTWEFDAPNRRALLVAEDCTAGASEVREIFTFEQIHTLGQLVLSELRPALSARPLRFGDRSWGKLDWPGSLGAQVGLPADAFAFGRMILLTRRNFGIRDSFSATDATACLILGPGSPDGVPGPATAGKPAQAEARREKPGDAPCARKGGHCLNRQENGGMADKAGPNRSGGAGEAKPKGPSDLSGAEVCRPAVFSFISKCALAFAKTIKGQGAGPAMRKQAESHINRAWRTARTESESDGAPWQPAAADTSPAKAIEAYENERCARRSPSLRCKA